MRTAKPWQAEFDRVAHDVRRTRELAQRTRFAPFGSEANGRKGNLETVAYAPSFFSIFAQLSRRPTVRLNTGLPGVPSLSAQK